MRSSPPTSCRAPPLRTSRARASRLAPAAVKVSGKADAYVDGGTVDANAGLSISATDSAAITATITLDTSAASDTGDNPFGSASALGVSGAVSMNDVRGGATAYIDGATVTASAGDVSVTAQEEATLTATLESAAD